MVNLIDCSRKEFIDRVQNKKLYCFGLGKRLQKFAEYCSEISVEGIIDNYCYRERTAVPMNGKLVPVVSAEKFAEQCGKSSTVVITCAAVEEILEQLDSMQECDGMECYVELLMDFQTEHNEIQIENLPTKPVIPKKIHYCWFGGKEMSVEYRNYMKSWKKYCPDYEIIRWDESNYDIHKNRYVREAYEQKMWAFVSDYARVDILYHEGGIYFDTDVEVIASFDELLVWDLFCGFERDNYIAWGLGVGAVQGHPILKDILEVYENMPFLFEDGSLNMKTCPVIQSEVMEKYGFQRNGKFQVIDNVAVFPREFFAPTDYEGLVGNITEYTHSIHHYAHPIHNAAFSWASVDTWIAREKIGERIRIIKQHNQLVRQKDDYAEQNQMSRIKRFQIWECLPDSNTAGSKAPTDVMNIFGGKGYQVIKIHPHNGAGNDWSHQRNKQEWQQCYEMIPEYSILLLQHPFWQEQKERNAVLLKLKKEKHIRIISFVHDVERLRGNFWTPYMQAEFAFMLQIADVLIVHNEKMKQFFCEEMGMKREKIVNLGIFDYLAEDLKNGEPFFEKAVHIAGNLDAIKSPYIRKLQELAPLRIHLYGPNYKNDEGEASNIIYRGAFPADRIIGQFGSGFGLVWDGDRLDTCAGNTGKYLKYNNPHKLSMYLAAGLPVIIWKEAAEAEFVEKNGVGITVDSLYGLNQIFEHMTEERYRQYVKAVEVIADGIRKGKNAGNAIGKAEAILESRDT
ncbi:MAG: hypothetical protein NC548_25895 [Lachnospiraceae bacterium]|nr:hypothetical protein [Lachnospiraceae bacterium]